MVGKEKCNSRFRFHRIPYDSHVRGRTQAWVRRARPCNASKKVLIALSIAQGK